MPLAIRIETVSSEALTLPAEVALPGLEQLDRVLAERRILYSRNTKRSSVVKRLYESHQRQGAPESSLKNIQRLESPDVFAIVTGQQPGLLTGALYTPWKILTAILLAKQLNRKSPDKFIPVFWNAGEDHDTAEMNHFIWLNQAGNPNRFELQLPDQPSSVPFGSRPIEQAQIERLLEFWNETLPSTEFSQPLRDRVLRAAQQAANLGEFCNQLLWQLFPECGLVIFDSFSGFYPALARDVFQLEIEYPLKNAEIISASADQLSHLGLKPQMHKIPSRCSFFLNENERRCPVHFAEDRFETPVAQYTTSALLKRLEEHPEHFSASASLRPVIQDTLLPTAVNVLGPNEYAYHLQLGEVYSFHDIVRPIAVERLHLTLLPPRVARGLEKTGLTLEELACPLEQLAKKVSLQQSPFQFEASIDHLKGIIEETLEAIREKALLLDKSLEPSIIGHKKQLYSTLEKIEDRLARALRASHQELEQTIARLQAVVYPGGQPQERVLNLYYFLNLFGLDLLEHLMDNLKDADPGSSFNLWVEHVR